MPCPLPLSLPNRDTAVVPPSGLSEVNHTQSVSHPLPLLVRQALPQCRRGKKCCRHKSNFRKTFCTSPVAFTTGVPSISLWTTQTQDFLSSGVFAEQAQVRFTEGVGLHVLSVCSLAPSVVPRGSFSCIPPPATFCPQIHAWTCCLPPNMTEL